MKVEVRTTVYHKTESPDLFQGISFTVEVPDETELNDVKQWATRKFHQQDKFVKYLEVENVGKS